MKRPGVLVSITVAGCLVESPAPTPQPTDQIESADEAELADVCECIPDSCTRMCYDDALPFPRQEEYEDPNCCPGRPFVIEGVARSAPVTENAEWLDA